MINYAIPGLYEHFQLNKKLIELMHSHPEYFYENIQIEAAYGVFPFCIFDGGRIMNVKNHSNYDEIKNIISFYNNNNISARLVYTNSQLQEKNYKNHFGNLCLSLCNDGMNNQVVIADENFMEYIKSNYDNLSFISSTTKCLNKEDFLIEIKNSKYIEVCLDYNLNHNFKFLKELTPEDKEKCEFLCNAICPPGCQTRKQHYKLNSLFNLSYGKVYAVPKCGINKTNLSIETKNFKTTMSYDDIKENYEPLGFKHFKLEGRTFSDLTQAIIYSDYMVKPEYKDEFLENILT